MAHKPAYTIEQQIALLKSRGMLFRDESKAPHLLYNISYYRLKGYWWDMQADYNSHTFKSDVYFEDIIDRYNFDRELRIILFDAIERIEIALRTSMIYHLSLNYGAMWYLQSSLFTSTTKHQEHVEHLQREFGYSQEIFAKEHRKKHPQTFAAAWKVMEVASMGTLSKFYKNLNHQLHEKSTIAKGMSLNLHSELSSWLEAITYVRNIIAHHSRLWSRNMVKKPIEALNNPLGIWFSNPLTEVQTKKPFLIISSMVYLSNHITQDNQIKTKILNLFSQYPNIPIYKLGFLNNWNNQPIWK